MYIFWHKLNILIKFKNIFYISYRITWINNRIELWYLTIKMKGVLLQKGWEHNGTNMKFKSSRNRKSNKDENDQ